ncbi:MAG: PD40 domain-containing protein [Bacteroidetes bacterium]|nr:PD40 domain-containing protein [Bacteroidota bacterium]
MKFKNTIIFIISFLLFCSFTPIKRYLKKAANETEKGNLVNAKKYYEKVLKIDPENYHANLLLGLLYSETIEDYSKALPYLEKSLQLSKKDTISDLLFALAKCYQNQNKYEEAIVFFKTLNGKFAYDENDNFQKDIKKRKEDCANAMSLVDKNIDSNVIILNLGKMINTENPEYVPVLLPSNELLFTSKRKDSKNEQINYLDGKYFESMYVSKYTNGKFDSVRRYTLPDKYLKSKYKKGNESIVSISRDGKTLFVYRNNRIFEVDANKRPNINPKKLNKQINFDFYQNHAFLSDDGKQLLFTSESENGNGDNDIYFSTKNENGEWAKVENIGTTINTPFDEDSPFITNNGKTMYFASKGHKGYGNYDTYKSELVNGKWTEPINLGQPINSSGHDIFYTITPDDKSAYYSSSRVGGYGDMDIYKIIFKDKIDTICNTNQSEIKLSVVELEKNSYNLTTNFNSNKNKIIANQWLVNSTLANGNANTLNVNAEPGKEYKINYKLTYICDSCLEPTVICLNTIFTSKSSKNDSLNPLKTNDTLNLATIKGELTDAQLEKINFDIRPILFDFDKDNINSEAAEILNKNIQVLKQYPSLSINIVGYTDQKGNKLYNQKLSVKRSKSVYNYLTQNGFITKHINKIIGLGASSPILEINKNQPYDKSKFIVNRRVLIKVFNK